MNLQHLMSLVEVVHCDRHLQPWMSLVQVVQSDRYLQNLTIFYPSCTLWQISPILDVSYPSCTSWQTAVGPSFVQVVHSDRHLQPLMSLVQVVHSDRLLVILRLMLTSNAYRCPPMARLSTTFIRLWCLLMRLKYFTFLFLCFCHQLSFHSLLFDGLCTWLYLFPQTTAYTSV